jgi:hypothetical protein
MSLRFAQQAYIADRSTAPYHATVACTLMWGVLKIPASNFLQATRNELLHRPFTMNHNVLRLPG